MGVMIILIHSSKTMKQRPPKEAPQTPQLLTKAKKLDAYLKKMSPAEVAKIMHVSAGLAQKTHDLIASWTDEKSKQSLAIDTFVGDIYSGLRGTELSADDRAYAHEHLRILSGLYGILRPLDGIMPYRLEMGYKVDVPESKDLYEFWGNDIAATLPATGLVVNVSSVEYTKAVLPFIKPERVITPQFLTISPKTSEPEFVVVHAKIARGAFARWLVTSRVTDARQFTQFAEIGYAYEPALSTPQSPAFVAKEFAGKGLSMRLT